MNDQPKETRQRRWYVANRDKILKARREYYLKNRESLLAKFRARYHRWDA